MKRKQTENGMRMILWGKSTDEERDVCISLHGFTYQTFNDLESNKRKKNWCRAGVGEGANENRELTRGCVRVAEGSQLGTRARGVPSDHALHERRVQVLD